MLRLNKERTTPMNKRSTFVFFSLLCLVSLLVIGAVAHGHSIAVLNPKGIVAAKERTLMLTATGLMLLVVIPVFILTFFIAWNYRASNTKATYTPEWDHHLGLEFIWWAVPSLIIVVLAVITWNAAHSLDPSKALASSNPPMTIEVVALDWKWLFIYPQQGIATVNYLEFPKNTPVKFEITSDAPMNSFWIPQLGGQIYAMPGMSTQLNLMATENGTYQGSSANISGRGFAGMKFKAQAISQSDFQLWVKTVQNTPEILDQSAYDQLTQPSENNPVANYSWEDPQLYDKIMTKYMSPMSTSPSMFAMPGMDMSGISILQN